MEEIANPYRSPVEEHGGVNAAHGNTSDATSIDVTTIAAQGARLANLIIDSIAQMVVGFLFDIVIVIIGGEAGARWLERVPNAVIGMPIALAYYFLLEASTSRTIGKLLTGTKVVAADGGRPTFGQVAVRTLCRYIPFEAFSFFGKPTRGWHDSISKTYVVKVR